MTPTAVNTVLVVLFVASALGTVLASTLLRAAIGLAATSAVLTLLMYQMDSPLAAAFELSVCAGLITVVFVSTISLTRPGGHVPDAEERVAARRRSFVPVLTVSAWVLAIMWMVGYALDFRLPAPVASSVREVLWQDRRFDLLGQIVLIFVGVYGVVILFKDAPTKEARK
jgi:NADH-quinone oxidoreductase subunit J